MWLDEEIFKCVVAHAPLVAIDLIVENREGKFLLGRRKNPPAKGFLFVPGGRILKEETIKLAFKRITKEELGAEIDITQTKFIGVFEHFYKESVWGDGISTHYVVLAHKLKVESFPKLPNTQHSEYMWLTLEEILKREDVHKYAKDYFKLLNKHGR